MFIVVTEVLLSFDRVQADVGRPAGGFLLDLEEGVHRIFEELGALALKMPDFIHFGNDVTLNEGFLEIGGVPNSGQSLFTARVRTMVGALQYRE